ncbi:SRPBCC domain-containing protein, partial [Sinorhizobium meliloti]
HQAPFTSAESRDSHAEGWSECMDRLVSYVAARKEEMQ